MKLSFIFSYLDPGTGSIVAQSIIGIIAGIGLFGRRLFANLVIKIRNLFTTPKKD